MKAALRELAPAEGQRAFTRLLAAIEQGTDRDQGELLMDVLAVVATKLPPAEARQTFDQLLTALSEKAPASWILPVVAAKLAPGEAQKARTQLLAAIERAVDHEILWTPAQALERVPGELAFTEAQQAFGRLLTAIQRSTTSYYRRGNAVPEALQAMAAKLAPSEAQRAFGQLLAERELLEKCRDAVRKVAPGAKVILYGSRARGNADRESDYDLLVLADGPVDWQSEDRIRQRLYSLELESGAALSVSAYNRSDWCPPLYRAMPFNQNVEKEGIAL